MMYSPGSFSKNFGWGGLRDGAGLYGMYRAIRAGYRDTLAPVRRNDFRTDCGKDANLSLIPVNFFLHNRDGAMSVDELVSQAIGHPHSIRFGRLALFALHLNRAGHGRDIDPRPAMWANEFVREQLWRGGTWRTDALSDDSLNTFLNHHLDATEEVRTKCRNNYRRLFQLCDFWPSDLSVINPGAEEWIAEALFLAWDRHCLDGGDVGCEALLELVERDEIHKLLGVPCGYALTRAAGLVDLYTSVDRLNRFNEGVPAPASVVPLPGTPAPETVGEEGPGWLEQVKSDTVVGRRLVERRERARDRRTAAALKRHYDNTCQFCGTRLQIARDRFYSEAAHIKGLGEPHNGPDRANNMLVLCPNHHLQFDSGFLRLRGEEMDYQIISKIAGDPLHEKPVTLNHRLDDDCVRDHFRWFSQECF